MRDSFERFDVAVHEDDVGAAEVAVARGIVEGGVVVDLPGLVADGEMRVVERGDAVALDGPGILLGKDNNPGRAIDLGFLRDAGDARAQPIGPDRAVSTHIGVHNVTDGGIRILRILGPHRERRA